MAILRGEVEAGKKVLVGYEEGKLKFESKSNLSIEA
jgi:hypothetical protein